MKTKFWYSANQRKWLDYVDANPILGNQPSHGKSYAVIDGLLVEYTECHVPKNDADDYSPNYDDVVFLGVGEYAGNDWNIKTYLKRHPEVRLSQEEWPEIVG